MVAIKKEPYPKEKQLNPEYSTANDPKHAHELSGTLGMAVGGVVGGIAVGAAAGAAIGGFAGPVGAVAGAAIGGALGGSAGESIAREVNPTLEEEYWESNYQSRPYIDKSYDFHAYRPAYRIGVEAYRNNPQETFESLEPSLQNNWNIDRGASHLEWDQARHAARDAFRRVATRQ